MNILILNAGSSSLRAAILDTESGERYFTLKAEKLLTRPIIHCSDKITAIQCNKLGHEAVIRKALSILDEKAKDLRICGVGHRVVHGGEAFDQAIAVNKKVEQEIETLCSLAPLHNPNNLLAIRLARDVFKDIPHIAVFDTAFHHSLPKRAKTYALPKGLVEKHNIRRYGFHGTSHHYVAQQAAKYLRSNIRALRIISCHLGNGASVAAIEFGRSVETSMGMTPLEGLVMGTRSGDIDPSLISFIADKEKLSVIEVEELLNKQSGLKGLSNSSNDMRDIVNKAANGNEDARLALHVFTHRVRKYIGAYAAIMGGVDAIVFTGGIGENSAVIRHRVAQRLNYLGAVINEDYNRDIRLSNKTPVAEFSMRHSRVKLLAIATDEQLEIGRQTAQVVLKKDKVNMKAPPIPIAVSARHVHLTQEIVDVLFGRGYQLTKYKVLSQPGQFAAKERITLVGPKNQIEHVRILGPTRPKNQVEISRTDEFFLGIDAPVRESGKVENTPGITLIGDKGSTVIEEGVICAWRHIHMTPADAKIFGVKDRDVVEVDVHTNERALTFGNVLIRVSPKYKLEMHIDTDEGNAAELGKRATGTLIKTEGKATLKKRKVTFDESNA